MKSLSDIRRDRAWDRLKKRQHQAERIFEVFDNYEAMQRLKFQAIKDYLEEVPELRELRRQAFIENKARGFI